MRYVTLYFSAHLFLFLYALSFLLLLPLVDVVACVCEIEPLRYVNREQRPPKLFQTISLTFWLQTVASLLVTSFFHRYCLFFSFLFFFRTILKHKTDLSVQSVKNKQWFCVLDLLQFFCYSWIRLVPSSESIFSQCSSPTLCSWSI